MFEISVCLYEICVCLNKICVGLYENNLFVYEYLFVCECLVFVWFFIGTFVCIEI